MKKTICLFFILSLFSQISNAQCISPSVGCSNTDLSNFGSQSNNNSATIEYDNFVSSWHTTVVRTSDGSFQTWGEKIQNSGATNANVVSPITINSTNYPALTGTPLKAGLGSTSQNNVQGIVLATDGLYAWSTSGIVLASSLTSGTAFQKLTIGGNTTGLPAGVTPGDVKMMFITSKTLVITTCNGDVWVISQTLNARGNGTTATSDTTWYRVKTSAAGNPFLTDVVACRGSVDGLMALKSDGTVYVWGSNVLVGNNTPIIASQPYAVQMTLPAGKTPKMIGSTGSATTRSYYILATDGNLYSLGNNSSRQLGDWTNANRLSWVQPKYTSASGLAMNDIKWISPQEHDSNYAAINVINNDKKLYAFGNSNNSLIGRASGTAAAASTTDPGMPSGLTLSDDILAVETGGHTSMIVKACEAKFGYVGHRTSGSMGNGSTATAEEASYTFATANVQICGAESNPAIQPISTGGGPNSKYCVGDPVLLSPTPAGGTLSILSGPGTLTGNTVNFTAAGTVVVQYSVITACGGTSVTTKNFDAALCPIDLEVTKTVDNVNASVGNNSTFTITTKNNGPYKATGVKVNDVLPAGYTLVSATPSTGTWTAPDWTVGSLTNGTSATLSIVATVNATGPYANTATVSGNDPDTDTSNNTATATPVVQTNLSVTKTASTGTHNVGTDVTFTITASNAGPSNATGVTVSDALPAGYTFVSATPSTGTWLAPNWTIGNLANGGNATLTIVATVNATGPYANTATITGGQNDPTPGNDSGSATPAVNHAPVANDDDLSAFPLIEDGANGTVNILSNDTDADGNPTAPVNGAGQFTVDLDPAVSGIQTTYSDTKGVWTLNTATGIVTFNPADNYNGTAKITYTLCDTFGLCDNADVTFVVTAVNDNPVANNDSKTTNEDTVVTIDVTANDTDVDGTIDVSTVDLDPATPGIQTTFTVAGQGTYTVSALGIVTFTPVLNYNGTATPINYTVNDNNGAVSNIATISITVTAVNDNPVAVDDVYTVAEDNTVTLNPLALDSDVDGDTLTITSINGTTLTGGAQTISVTNGTINISATGVITFTPAANFNSVTPISIPYVISDGHGGTATANQLITVTSVNDNPIANNDSKTTNEDTVVTIDVTANDTDVDGTIDVSTVDLDPATPGIQTTFTVAGQGTYTVSALGIVTFTPVLNYNGTATPINYTVNDNNGAVSNIATISITVTAVNDNPVANNDSKTTNEDTVVTIDVTANDTDVDGTIDVATVDLDPATPGIQTTFTVAGQGTYTVSALGIVTFTPVLNYNGTATPINYTVNDNNGAVSNIATISITVTSVNDNPIAVDDVYTVAEDNTVTLTPLALDSDVDGDTLTITSINGTSLTGGAQTIPVTNGTVNIFATGVITFTPAANFNSVTPISIPYVISDGNGGTATANQLITVTAVNDNPVAVDDVYTVAEDNTVTLNPLNLDSDVDGDTLTITSINGTTLTGGAQTISVTNGTVTISATGVITFTPAANFNSITPISFPYIISDGNGGTATANQLITVTAVNDNPVAVDDVYTVAEDNTVTLNPLALDSDVDGDTLTITSINGTTLTGGAQTISVTNGTVTISATGVITFTPAANFNSATPISIPYVISDGNGGTATANQLITVTSVNDNPVANNDSKTTNEDTVVTIDVTANDTDVDGTIDVSTVDLDPATPGIQTTFTVAGQGTYTVSALGIVTFTPVLNYNGTATPINYTVNDNNGAVSNIATISITVTAVNDNPVAVDDVYTVAEDNTVTLNPLALDSDVDGDTLTITSINGTTLTGGAQTIAVTNGTVNISATGVITFTPDANFNSATPVSIPYVISDGNGGTATANQLITVTSVNDNPVANNDSKTTNEDTIVTIDVTANDTDVDGTIDVSTVDLDPATPGIQTTFTVAGQGTYTVSALGIVTFTPVLNYNGTATPINYTVNDNNGAVSNIATISITVTAVNDNPIAVDDVYMVAEDNTVTLNPLALDSDVDGDTLTITSINGTTLTGGVQTIAVTNGTVNISATGVITFTPDANFNSAAPISIPYVISDGNGGTATANELITVTAVNDNPVAIDDVYTVAEDNAVTLNPLNLDSDVDGDTLTITSINGTTLTGGVQTIAVTNGTVTISATGVITFTPAANFNSVTPISIPYVISDGNGGTATANQLITVTAVNDAPVANNDTNGTIPSTSGATAINVLTATDIDGTIASYTVLTLPAHGVLALAGTPVTAGQVLTPAEAALLTYAPGGKFTGDDSFTFTATDDMGAVATAATITIPVGNNAPVAHDDTNAGIPSRAGATAINALSAIDTDGTIVSYTVLSLPTHGVLALSGTPIVVNQVLTPLQASMLTYDPSGAFSGNDTFTFTATDNNGAIDATPAVITIVIEKTILNAVADPINSVVGINKPVSVVNVLNNDTLNNSPLDPADVNLNVLTPDPKGVLILKPDGTIELIPNAPAGTYTLTYEICEKANSSNCSTATVSVTVVAPTMTVSASSYCSDNTPYVTYNVTADNFTPTGLLTINWIDSANNIVATQNNMPLSGTVLWPGATVDANNKPTDWPGWVLVNGQWVQGNDGFELTRPAVTMQFTLNPTQSVVVNYPSAVSGCNAMPTFGIQAGNEDDVTLADGLNGSLEVINVLDNDKLNSVPVKPSDVILKGLDFPTGITLNADGTIDVAPGTKGGSHTLTYQICEVANSSNCATATVKIFVEIPAIAIVKTVVLNDSNGNEYAEAGETLTYSFTIVNTGNTDLQNIIVSDPLPGIVMSGGPINLAVGQTDNSSFTGTYTLTQADVNSGTISNQATASGATKSGITVSDKSDFKDLDGEKATVLTISGCVIKIFNAVSSNGDNKNERFYVQGLECYPDNTVQIYNRWGVLVFERDHYNNNDIAFRGISEGRVTIKDSNGLPEGTYYYIIKYKDKQSNPHQEAGYLYLTK